MTRQNGLVQYDAYTLLSLARDIRASRAFRPSARECGFCEITAQDCPECVESEQVSEGRTTDF